jgi:NAD(P) transhydrogenase subunit beta
MTVAQTLTNLAYILACVSTITGIKMLGKPGTARRGMLIAAAGTIVAVIAVFFDGRMLDTWDSAHVLRNGFFWCFIAIFIGSLIGAIWAKKVKMTGMPELVALFNGFGGLASALVAFSEFFTNQAETEPVFTTSIAIAIFIGTMTFSGSLLAWGKLSEKITGRAIVFKGQKLINLLLLLVIVGAMVSYIALGLDSDVRLTAVIVLASISFIFGVTFVLPIGGGDMPVIISLLNSLTGIAVAMAGFIITNTVLIVTGALVGASGVILTIIMCKAMNRSLGNLLFSGFGATETKSSKGPGAEPKAISVEDAYPILEAASSVVVIPGYGMAVAQAQHVVKELAEKLEGNGTEVNFCIHPVAGRMPGHMNVLLAEADIDYDQLKTMDELNPSMPNMDVAIVIGANDVVNPAALTDESSPIYGMPIINAHEVKTVFVLKRGKGRGFSGIENELFGMSNTLMIYGDAKATISSLAAEFSEA